LISPARHIAFRVLEGVERGGYASDLLLDFARELSAADAGLATELVFGSLRRQMQLDYRIELHTRRRAPSLDAAVRISLRLGIYQLIHLERVPAHAAVHESVELVKRARLASAAGLVNAVLRRVAQERNEPEWPTRELTYSIPDWLLRSWDRQFGSSISNKIAASFLRVPETYVRNPTADRDGVELEPADLPGAYRVVRGDPGGLRIQDVGAQSVVPLLDLQRGMRFIDLCAAPGNKTAQALESGVAAIACDVHLHRLRSVTGCSRVALDATRPLPFRGHFDRILADVPCSGTGTLGRNPEIRYRLRPDDIRELSGKQLQIAQNAIELLAPGGRMVYSTCSLERQENESVVAQLNGVSLIEETHRLPGIQPGDGFYAAVLQRL
jgi:16S rRNA (cytosine967-C5)-methyltransferase